MTKKHILLGVTGGVAAYKSIELVRLLVKAGYSVQVVMTEAATHFIAPLTFQAVSGQTVYSDIWDDRPHNAMAHINLSRSADAYLIAPTTANMLFKIANGVCDDLVSTLAAARACPLILAPAMNRQMWENPPTQRHVKQLHNDGVTLWGPASGQQACGEEGMGRLIEPQDMVTLMDDFFCEKSLAGKRVLITAGSTYEAIDAVRGLTNISSGKMGYALANACRAAGATVTLISGPTALPKPFGLTFMDVISAQEMYDVVMKNARDNDVFISVAAVADYRVKNRQEQKAKKEEGIPILALEENPDILASVANLPNAPFCVGFAAESENLLAYAQAKRQRKNIPLIVANLVQSSMGSDENEVILVEADRYHALPNMSKANVAKAIVQHVADQLSR